LFFTSLFFTFLCCVHFLCLWTSYWCNDYV
jgi:hypothetical protein